MLEPRCSSRRSDCSGRRHLTAPHNVLLQLGTALLFLTSTTRVLRSDLRSSGSRRRASRRIVKVSVLVLLLRRLSGRWLDLARRLRCLLSSFLLALQLLHGCTRMRRKRGSAWTLHDIQVSSRSRTAQLQRARCRAAVNRGGSRSAHGEYGTRRSESQCISQECSTCA